MVDTGRFRDAKLVHQVVGQINELAEVLAKKFCRPVQLMEVCGGHTHAIFHAGIDQLLTKQIEFIHGPGCPVCVLPAEAVDKAVALAQQPDVILTSFGDVLRVPGNNGSLQQVKASGADVRILYSPFDAIQLAKDNPHKRVVFFAIGFDTTMPSIALTIKNASNQNIPNLQFLCYHIRLIPTLYALLDKNEIKLDGFIGPGHVSIVVGSDAYSLIASKYHKPLVIAGFEPLDFLQAMLMLLKQLNEQRCEIENAYTRVVTKEGNLTAQAAMEEVFADSKIAWRGMGEIDHSVGSLKPAYANYDATADKDSFAKTHVSDHTQPGENPYCSMVLTGSLKPHQCPNFRKGCDPQSPMGALMISSEGACAAYYKYKQTSNDRELLSVS